VPDASPQLGQRLRHRQPDASARERCSTQHLAVAQAPDVDLIEEGCDRRVVAPE